MHQHYDLLRSDEVSTDVKEREAVDQKTDEIYYDLIPEIVKVCHTLNFQQAEELMEATGHWDDPFLVRCTDKSWKKSSIVKLNEEVGEETFPRLYTVRFLGGPKGNTLCVKPMHTCILLTASCRWCRIGRGKLMM